MMKKITVLSLLVASFTFGVNATEGDEGAKYEPDIKLAAPEHKEISPEEQAMIQNEMNDEETVEKKCKEKECDENEMEEEEKVEEANIGED